MIYRTHIYNNKIFIFNYKTTKEDEDILASFLEEPYELAIRDNFLADDGTELTILKNNKPYFTDYDNWEEKEVFNRFYIAVVNYFSKKGL